MEVKEFIESLKKRGVRVNIDYNKGITLGYSEVSIDWELSELPFCCGMDELGNFDICLDELADSSDKTVRLSKTILVALVAEALKDLVSSYKISATKYVKKAIERKILVNIIDDYELIEKAIRKTKLFKKIGFFTNSNSNNVVRTYISK